ncbi:MAG: hypothetical protein H6744_18055 [Deltaproteobacteria bacterium]|nr:hypothetical protein [Deltaproteobacteria bacterium]MCB9788585.1 hypothetical protein [Deltaproteobacteria bacterium]
MRTATLVCLTTTACVLAPAAFAATESVQLPTSGLEVRLTAPKGHTWKVTSRWTPTTANDVIALEPPRAGTPDYMVEVGLFTKRCADWVQSGSYTTSTRGTFPTPSKLRRWNAVTGWLRYGKETRGLVCLSRPSGLEMLVQVRLPDADTMADPEKAVKSAVLGAASHLEAIRKAFESFATYEARPTSDPRVSGDGSPTARRVHLKKSGVDVDIPADGAYWRYVENKDNDALIRHVPRLPEISARVYGLPNQDCGTWLDSMASRLANPARRLFDYAGIPAGWDPGAIIWEPAEDRRWQEVTVCYQAGANALGVALISTPAQSDATAWTPLLKALGDAAQRTVPAGTPARRDIPSSGLRAAFTAGGPLLLPATGARIELPGAANQMWSVNGSAVAKSDGTHVYKDMLSRWVRGEFQESVRIQMGDLSDGCPEWLSLVASGGSFGGRLELSGEAGGGLYGTAAWAVFESKPRVAVCAESGRYRLNVLIEERPQTDPKLDEAKARGLLASHRALIQTLLEAWQRGADDDARPAHDPRLLAVALPGPRKVHLPASGLDLNIPDDGLFWDMVAAEGDGDGLDSLTLRVPAATMTDIYLEPVATRSDCAGLIQEVAQAEATGSTSQSPPNLPTGWHPTVARFSVDPGSQTLVLCHSGSNRAVLAYVVDRAPVQDLARYVLVLGAIARASDSGVSAPKVTPPPARATPPPTPEPRPVVRRETPPPPPPTPSGRRSTKHFMGWWETEVALSHRDSPRDKSDYPDTRVTYLGAGMGFMNAQISGFSWNWRLAAGGSFDWRGAFGPRHNTPEFGGQHWYLDADVGFGFGMGRSLSLTFSPGWHATSGPITRNAGFVAGLMLLHAPPDDEALAWSLRVTPVFLMTRNNQNLMAPLQAEFRLFVGGALSLGVEFQYIDPDADTKKTPAKAWATIFKFGVGFRSSRSN